jgi:bla regulator protein blaR1
MRPIIDGVIVALGGSLAAAIAAKATLTTALALVAVRLAHRSRAAVRHALLAAAFTLLAALPVASMFAPSIGILLPVAAEPVVAPSVDLARDTTSVAPRADEFVVPAPADSESRTPSWTPTWVMGWAAGATLFLLPMMAGLWQMRSLRRSGLPWREGGSIVERLAREANIDRRVAVLLHESIPGPMTCGVVRPAILLPLDAQTWTAEDLHCAIVHELEHVRRGDWITQCLSRALCACYWFHPLVWTAWRRLALEAERACDDAVLRRAEPTAYADQLVLLARRLSTGPQQPLLAMANRADLATRVVAVLDSRRSRGRAGVLPVALVCAASIALLAIMSPLRIVAVARATEAGQPAPSAPKFDVASIKPCSVEEAPPGPARGGAGGTNATFSPGRMNVPCVTLEQLIYLAYAGTGATAEERLVNDDAGQASDQIKVRGGPAWVHSQRDKYAIEATAAGASERFVLLGSMLRSMLEDRFHLKIHRETEEVPMYALTVAKGGFRLKPMKDGECDPDRTAPFDLNAAKPPCSSLTSGGNGPNAVWRFTGFEVRSVAARLSRTLDRHVIDRTGISGLYIIRLEFHPDESTPGIKWPAERDADTSAPPAASVFTALEQQLGLKLEPTRAPRGYLVIDHVERPTPNSPPGSAEPPARARGSR